MSKTEIKSLTVALPNPIIESEVIKTFSQKFNLKSSTPKLEVCQGSRKGDNYMGVIYRVVINLDAEERGSSSIICKTEPESQARREHLRTRVIFNKEAFVYNELLKEYAKFEDFKKIPQDLHFINYPTCLATGEGFLILTDMCNQGFKMHDPSTKLDLNHVALAFKMLGHFHALGYAIKYQKPDLLKTFLKPLEDKYFGEPVNKGLYDYIKVMFRHSADTLDKDEEARSKIINISQKLDVIIPRMMTCADAEPYAVITHGDFWRNNIMYKYQNGDPKSACLLDYQMCRYASPALDLAYFIFCCTDKSFRDSSYTQVLKIYYESLSTHLHYLGLDALSVLPYQELERHMKQFGLYGVVIASLILKSESLDDSESFDLDQVADILRRNEDMGTLLKCSDKSWKIFKNRMGSVLRDANELGMLD